MAKTYRPTIGLEIHAELNTASKMFCGCKNDPDEAAPNRNICPVCMAHPGTLPVVNREAVHKVLLVGTALGGTIPDRTYFDRKNYFYPDIPKGFQTSQYKDPLVQGGSLAGVAVTRVHLEEDTARSSHEGGKSLIDFNRAGVPLMELVTEPVIHDQETAGRFARELQLLLRTLGVGEANMEKGEMRVEANISVSADETFGTKVEVKNLNSFRSVERAIQFEVARQIKLIEEGGKVSQETRGWDEQKQSTFSQRKKESSHDYRYFPEPDIPEFRLKEIQGFSAESLKSELPELPEARLARYAGLGLKLEDAEILTQNLFLQNLFEGVAGEMNDASALVLAANYLISDVASMSAASEQESHLTAASFAEVIGMLKKNLLSSRGAKDLLAELFRTGGNPAAIAEEKGLLQQSDAGALEAVAQKIIANHSQVAEDYKAGKTAALQFLVGQAMKETRGSANPEILRAAFQKILG